MRKMLSQYAAGPAAAPASAPAPALAPAFGTLELLPDHQPRIEPLEMSRVRSDLDQDQDAEEDDEDNEVSAECISEGDINSSKLEPGRDESDKIQEQGANITGAEQTEAGVADSDAPDEESDKPCLTALLDKPSDSKASPTDSEDPLRATGQEPPSAETYCTAPTADELESASSTKPVPNGGSKAGPLKPPAKATTELDEKKVKRLSSIAKSKAKPSDEVRL
mmetsp:Transcript_2535/g.7029  ORF Transcript_2535/g.7029 Transcript_2535/m.7029 type:complete len:222 (+) Transcript_2535:2-667(+)